MKILKKIRRLTLKGRPWTIHWLTPKESQQSCLVGSCDKVFQVIEILDNKEDPLDTVDTLIHELLHAEFPGLSERRVKQAASDIVDTLCRLNLLNKE
jgi:hypothetical protein